VENPRPRPIDEERRKRIAMLAELSAYAVFGGLVVLFILGVVAVGRLVF